MPFDVRMPDGTLVRNVPDGTTRAQLNAKLHGAQPSEFTKMVDPWANIVRTEREDTQGAAQRLKSDFAPDAVERQGIGPGFNNIALAAKTIWDVLGYSFSGVQGIARGVAEDVVPKSMPRLRQAAGEAAGAVAPMLIGGKPAAGAAARVLPAGKTIEGSFKEVPPEEPPSGPAGAPAEAPKQPAAPKTEEVGGVRMAGDVSGLTPEQKARNEAILARRAAAAKAPSESRALVPVKSQVPATTGRGGGKGGEPPTPPGDPSFHWPDREDSEGGGRPPEVTEKEVFQMGRNLDDVLYRVQTNNDADKIEARQYLENLDAGEKEARPWWKSPDFQERAYNEVEENLKDPHARLSMSDDVKEFLGSKFGRWYAEQNALFKWIRGHPTAKNLIDADSLPDIQEGYVHRIPKGKGSMYDKGDPESYDRDVLARGRTLSKQASGLKSRKYFVLEGPDGKRAFATREFVDKDEPYHGKTYTHQGKTYTAKYATTKEIEEATASGKYGYTKPRTYHKNLLVNTVENVLRLRRVKRAMMITDALKKILTDRGLLYYGDDVNKAPADFITTRLPQFMGARMHPAFAYALDDFFGSLGDDVNDVELIEKVNRLITRSIFFTPFPHLENVGAFWATTRAPEWVRPRGWSSLVRNTVLSVKDVVTQGPMTRQLLREGAALQYPRIANQNFYKLMIERMGKEIDSDPQTWAGVAKNFGFRTPKDLVKMFYRTSQKAMWMGNDIFMQQRIRELMDQGVPMASAIKRAERDIPNYRIPSQVWRGGGKSGRIVSQFLQNPNYIMFGRYKYDQVKFITQLANDLIRGRDEELKALRASGMSKAEAAKVATGTSRGEALAKAIFLVGFGTGAFALGDRAVQAVTGNKDARLRRPGPWALQDDIEQWATGAKDAIEAISSMVSLAPSFDITEDIIRGTDDFGRPIFKPGASTFGHVVEGAEAAAGKFAPVGQVMQMAKPGGTAQVAGRNFPIGVSIPPPGSKARAAKAKRYEAKRGRKAEARDPIENAIKAGLKELGF